MVLKYEIDYNKPIKTKIKLNNMKKHYNKFLSKLKTELTYTQPSKNTIKHSKKV